MSSLARLVPDLVLQNLLPIFISVGANAVQRDDAYTFRVVERVSKSEPADKSVLGVMRDRDTRFG